MHLKELKTVLMFHIIGDNFSDLDDQQAIDAFMDWDNRLRVLTSLPSISKLVDSIKSLEISFVSMKEMREADEKEKPVRQRDSS